MIKNNRTPVKSTVLTELYKKKKKGPKDTNKILVENIRTE